MFRCSSWKIPKKESKLNQNWELGSALERANWHSWSADWHNFEARPRNALFEIKHVYFEFLGIRMQPNSYLIRFRNQDTFF